MWLKILKYALQVAVATGVADKGKTWLKRKINGAYNRACDKAEEKINSATEVMFQAHELHPSDGE